MHERTSAPSNYDFIMRRAENLAQVASGLLSTS